MKNLLLVALCFAAIGSVAQYEEERHPLKESEITFYKNNKIAAVVAEETTADRTVIKTQRFDKSGLLIYKGQKNTSEFLYHYQYNKSGQMVEIADSNYDLMFKKWWKNTQTFEYYGNGLLKERSLNGTTTRFEYNKKENKLAAIQPEEVADGSTTEYFYDAGQKLVKTFTRRATGEEHTEYKEYDKQGNVVKMFAITKYPGIIDSLSKTYTYNSNGNRLTEQWVKTSRSAPLNDEGEPDESGQWEETTNRHNWVYEYDEKGRLIKSTLTTGDDNVVVLSNRHTFAIENGIETEHIVTTDGQDIITEETIVYNGPKGLKGTSTRKETRREKQTTTTTTYTYTFF